jgi:hypothetical protein
MVDTLSNSTLFAIAALTAAAAVLSSIAAWLLRGARFPGGWASAAILGGLLAGVFLGPGVLGRVAPEAHRAVTLGGIVEERDFAARLVEARGAVAALEASGVTGVAIDEYEQRAMADLEPLGIAVDEARITRRGEWDLALALLGAALLTVLPLAGVRGDSGDIPFSARRAAMLAGFGSVLIAGGIAFVGVSVFTHAGPSDAALLFAAACAVGWFIPPLDRAKHERLRAIRESFISGLFALAAGSAICLWYPPDMRGWFVAWAFIGALTLWTINMVAIRNHRARSMAQAAVLGVLAPTVVAMAASRLDPIPLAHEPEFWVTLIFAVIACTDGRWFGALIGARALESGRGILTTRSVEIATSHANAGAGLAQVALFAILAAGGPIDERLLAAGLLGALLLESSAGLYRLGGAWLERSIAEK